jgi:hypothetical protein
MPRESIDRLVQLIPGARMLTLEGFNHYMITLAPDALDRFSSAIEDLMARR